MLITIIGIAMIALGLGIAAVQHVMEWRAYRACVQGRIDKYTNGN
jgi:hypothetical protein